MNNIIDFHTHPYSDSTESIKRYKNNDPDTINKIKDKLNKISITKICGSVLHTTGKNQLENMLVSNNHAFMLSSESEGFYYPGIHVNPNYPLESVKEIDKALQKGFRLIGELVPKTMGWSSYSADECHEIFSYAENKNMIVSCHPTDFEDMDHFAELYPSLRIVFAHPGEREFVENYIKIMKNHKNVFLDISGTGLFRNGLLRYLIDNVGSERVIFGSDYPVCNPGMYVGGVEFENLTERELSAVFYENAKDLLNI